MLQYPDVMSLVFSLSNTTDLLVYAHNPGEEVWFPYAWTPGSYPRVVIERKSQLVDMRFTRVKTVQFEKECRPDWTLANYSGQSI